MPVPDNEQETGTVILISSTASSAETEEPDRHSPEMNVIATRLQRAISAGLVLRWADPNGVSAGLALLGEKIDTPDAGLVARLER